VGEKTPAPEAFRSAVGVFVPELFTAAGGAVVEVVERSGPVSAEPVVLVEVDVLSEDDVVDKAS